MVNVLWEIEGEAIPNSENITSAEISLYYTWDDEK